MKSSLKLVALGIAVAAAASPAYSAITLTNAENSYTPWTGLDYASQDSAAWTEQFGAAFAQVMGGGGPAAFTIRFAGLTGNLTGVSLDVDNLDTFANGIFKGAVGVQSYEYTTVGEFSATLLSCTAGGASCDFRINSGTFDVYYDVKGGTGTAAKTAKNGQWSGFDDGTKIITGNLSSIAGQDSTFNDVSGGAVTLAGAITYTNSAFISPDLAYSNITSTLQLGAGLTGFNGPLSSLLKADSSSYTVGANEIVFQADGNHTFTELPEPSSILLAGLALAGIGGAASRRRKTA